MLLTSQMSAHNYLALWPPRNLSCTSTSGLPSSRTHPLYLIACYRQCTWSTPSGKHFPALAEQLPSGEFPSHIRHTLYQTVWKGKQKFFSIWFVQNVKVKSYQFNDLYLFFFWLFMTYLFDNGLHALSHNNVLTLCSSPQPRQFWVK